MDMSYLFSARGVLTAILFAPRVNAQPYGKFLSFSHVDEELSYFLEGKLVCRIPHLTTGVLGGKSLPLHFVLFTLCF